MIWSSRFAAPAPETTLYTSPPLYRTGVAIYLAGAAMFALGVWSLGGTRFFEAGYAETYRLTAFRQQRNRLRKFVGQGLRCALAATHAFHLPGGLTAQTLEQYHEVARQMIQEGRDPMCVQCARLCLAERALSPFGAR